MTLVNNGAEIDGKSHMENIADHERTVELQESEDGFGLAMVV